MACCSSSSPSPPWIELPTDVTANILRRLSPDEILNTAERVCTTWRRICGEPSLWRVFDMKCSDILDARQVFRRAVDRSQGEMIVINIRGFGNNDLLQYVSKRLSHLKILSLQSCYGVSPGGLTTAVKNFPLLEELHLFEMPLLCWLNIEAIGISCPMLKSFTFYNRHLDLVLVRLAFGSDTDNRDGLSVESETDNRDALSIAKTMPNLLRLCLFGNLLNNEGLLAILDGCPNLVSLDLRKCFGVDLKCDLGRRCAEQIKELRCDDPEFDGGLDDFPSLTLLG